MNYIDRIKKLKSEKKITNDRLSELTGIPLGTLSKLLAGISDSPKLSNIIAISDALGCSLDYIVSGKEDNDYNFTLTDDEMDLVRKYRELDACGRDIATFVVNREYSRVADAPTDAPQIIVNREKIKKPDTQRATAERKSTFSRRSIFLYDMPVSAGSGVYLDDTTAEKINIPDNEKTVTADFALRISGNSMEPKYHDGDILLVENADITEVGELGIFVLDGSGYFKKYGGDRLISLNPEFADILLKDYSEVACCGRVVGKLKRK